MTAVIIDDTLPYTQSIANGSQTVFDTDWTADAASDVVVYARADGVAPNDVTQIVSPSLYNVTFVGAEQFVRVTFLSGRTLGDVITITRNTPEDRDNLYINTNFTPSMLNGDFGRYLMMIQQNTLHWSQLMPRYNTSATVEPVVDTILPILPAETVWVKNAANTAIIAASFPEAGAASKVDTYVTIEDERANEPNSYPLSIIAAGIMVNNPGTGINIRTLTGTTDQINIANGSGAAGNPTFSIANNPVMPGTAGMGIPQGTTAQRVTPATGIGLRFNTDLGQIEFWDGSSWTQVEDSSDIATLLAMLASHTAGEGASLIGLEGTGTVQDLAEAPFIVQTPNAATPNAQALSALTTGILKSTTATGVVSISAPLTSIDGLTTVANNMLYASAPNTYGVIAPVNSAVMVSGVTGVPGWTPGVSIGDVLLFDGTTWASAPAPGIRKATPTNIGDAYSVTLVPPITSYEDGFQINIINANTNATSSPTINIDGLGAVPIIGSSQIIIGSGDFGGGAAISELIYNAGTNTFILQNPSSSQWANLGYQAGYIDVVYDTGIADAYVGEGDQFKTVNADGFFAQGYYIKLYPDNDNTGACTFDYADVGVKDIKLTDGSDPVAGMIKAGMAAQLMYNGTVWQLLNPSPVIGTGSPLTTKGDLYTFSTTNDRLAVGPTDGQILQVNAAAATGLAWSTATFASTYGASELLYSNGANTVVGLATANGSVLTTGAGGVPAWVAAGAVGNVLTSDGTVWTSAAPADASVTITDDTTTNAVMYPTWVTANTGTLPLKVTSTKLFYNPSTGVLTNIGALGQITGFKSSAGLDLLTFNYTASAVNHIEIKNAATGQGPTISFTGSDGTVNGQFASKNGNFKFFDTTGANAGLIRLMNAANTFGISLRSPIAQAADIDYQLPGTDANGVMKSDGAGTLSLDTMAGTDITGTVTVNGFSSLSLNVIRQSRLGKLVHIEFNISGTSNSTAFTITNMPVSANATLATIYTPVLITNNGTNAIGLFTINGTTVTFYLSPSSNTWTNSGGKSAFGSIWYEGA